MKQLLSGLLLASGAALLAWWYRREVLYTTSATIRLQSEHEHFHLHVDLPDGLEIEPGDTIHVLRTPEVPAGQTHGEISYESPVHLYKASWLRRVLVKNSSLVEVNELVDHP